MKFILPLIEEIEHNVKVFNKLVGTEYEYYCVYIFCNILKFFSYFKVSYENGSVVRVFNYLKELEGILDESKMNVVRLAISLSRRSDRLKDNYKLVDISELRSIISEILGNIKSKFNHS
jgi:hypothetical protein